MVQNAINDIRREICGGEISLAGGRPIQHRWSFCFQNTTASTVQSQKNYSNPSGCIELISVAIGTDPLEKISFEQWQRDYQGSTAEDQPEVWVPRNEEYWVAKLPDGVYTMNLYYYGYLADLVNATDEEALEKKFPMLVIYGACMMIAEQLYEDNLIGRYNGLFEKKLLSAIASDKGLQRTKWRPRFKTWLEDDVKDEWWRA
jgi:hypothetical protein